MLMLIVVGVFLVLSHQMSVASSGTVTVGAVVNGPPPTIGATITSPADGAVLSNQPSTVVSGTCQPSSFVVVQRNSTLAGSTNCSGAGLFSLTLSVVTGQNSFTALNYDNANQAGPITPTVTITVQPPTEEPEPEEEVPSVPQPPLPSFPEIILPSNPSIIPGLPIPDTITCPEGSAGFIPEQCKVPVNCETYSTGQKIPSGGRVAVDVVCIPRIVQQNTSYTLGVIVSGGTPPYALSIDFGESNNTALLSITKPGYKTVPFRYTSSGAFNVKMSVTDSKGVLGSVETAVQVNGEGKPLITAFTEAIAPQNWLTSPVPLYIVAVFVTLAFWGGDIFYRFFGDHGARHTVHRRRKVS